MRPGVKISKIVPTGNNSALPHTRSAMMHVTVVKVPSSRSPSLCDEREFVPKSTAQRPPNVLSLTLYREVRPRRNS